ncbi:hypothetical protein KNE206_42800 [Kitasatospora sp. NE20-6]
MQLADGVWPGERLGVALPVAVGAGLVAPVVADGRAEEGTDVAEREGAGRELRVVAEGDGAAEVEAGAAEGVLLADGTAASTGAVSGRAAPLPSGAARASTPAPPRARPAAVSRAARRRPAGRARRERRPRRSAAVDAYGAVAGSTVVASRGCAPAGAPHPGHDSAPLRWRRHGAQ